MMQQYQNNLIYKKLYFWKIFCFLLLCLKLKKKKLIYFLKNNAQYCNNNYRSNSISFWSASLFLFHLISLLRYRVINLVVLTYISFNSYSLTNWFLLILVRPSLVYSTFQTTIVLFRILSSQQVIYEIVMIIFFVMNNNLS